MDDNLKQQLLFEANRKSAGAAYLLWFFLGGFGAHRFYLNHIGSGIAQLLLLALGWIPLFIGWAVLAIWWLIDAFLIPDMIRIENLKTIQMIESGRSYADPVLR